ncbi:MAG: hypothetical protein FKY71_09885 [Spiribacter salinus]|uniref:Uncharacterized protein n=1 Tax=Spiribacter salinus TaxID=1335746 RepID=A0A540VQZ8_9GAMM|nr:MAG: hypothetical protein FKY71_09885 [Spiribacter salinus]
MFGTNMEDFPTLTDFAGAEYYLRGTKPMASGPNKGTVPLRLTRRDPDTYHIYESTGVNPYGKPEPQRTIVCQMYNTQIVIFYEDGTIELDNFHTSSTHGIQSELLGSYGNVSSTNGFKIFRISSDQLHSSFASPFVETTRQYVSIPFSPKGNFYLVQAPDGTYTPHNYGVAIGRTRRYFDPVVGKAVRAVQRTLRQMSQFAQTEFFPDLKGNVVMFSSMYSHHLAQNYAYLRQQLDNAGWAPGKPVTPDVMNVLLDRDILAEYRKRMQHLSELRPDPRPVWPGAFDDVLALEDAEDLCIEIEQIESGDYLHDYE